MVKTDNDTRILFAITEQDVQSEAIEQIGRTLNEDEMEIAQKGLEWGIVTGIHIVYKTILFDMIMGK